MGANSFLLEYTPFQKGLRMQKRKLEVTKVVSLVNLAENVPSVYINHKYVCGQPRLAPVLI